MAYTMEEIKNYILTQTDQSPEAIYKAAQQYGVSGPELDKAMGWAAGTADKWVRDQGKAAITPIHAVMAQTMGSVLESVVNTKTTTPKPTDIINVSTDKTLEAIPSTTPVTSMNPKYTPTEIKDYIQTQTDQTPEAIYKAAKEYGVTGAEIDKAMGYEKGVADAWVTSQGLASITPPPTPNTSAFETSTAFKTLQQSLKNIQTQMDTQINTYKGPENVLSKIRRAGVTNASSITPETKKPKDIIKAKKKFGTSQMLIPLANDGVEETKAQQGLNV